MKTIDLSSIKWPKSVTEQHVHLGGAVPLYRLWEMAVERGVRGIGRGYDEFIALLRIHPGKVRDLDSYLEVYDRIELIQSGPHAVHESVLVAIHGLHRTEGMKRLGPGGEGGDPEPIFKLARLELRFNPLKRTGAVFLKGSHAGLYDVDRIIKSACAAVEELELSFRGNIEVGLVFCLGRDMTAEANLVLARKIAEWKDRSPKIVGVDLAGSESVNSLADPKKLQEIKAAYDTVGSGIGRTVHVGETKHVDINTFINTINAVQPHRVAHPISALRAYWEQNNDRGLKLLKERGIVCELCVKSNLLTGAVGSIAEYGKVINTLDQFEIPYSFSTDAPALQVTSLAEELLLLIQHGAATEEQVLRALKTADETTFLNRKKVPA